MRRPRLNENSHPTIYSSIHFSNSATRRKARADKLLSLTHRPLTVNRLLQRRQLGSEGARRINGSNTDFNPSMWDSGLGTRNDPSGQMLSPEPARGSRIPDYVSPM